MKRRGSITLEAAVVMPIVLIVSVIMVYFLFIYYEKTTLSAACYNYAEAIAKYSNPKYILSNPDNTDEYFYKNKISWQTDLKTGKSSFRYPVYWRFRSKEYLPKESLVAKKIEQRMIFKHGTKLKVRKKTGMLTSYIIVDIEKPVKELGILLSLLGINDGNIIIRSSAKAIVSDQPETIRNVELITDGVRLIPGAGETIDAIKDGLKKSLDKLLE